MSKKQETNFSQKVYADLELLQREDFLWFKKITQVAVRGVPDYLLCVRGIFVALELKREEGIEADPLQKYNMSKISRAGGHSFLVVPENWDDCLLAIKKIGNDHAKSKNRR